MAALVLGHLHEGKNSFLHARPRPSGKDEGRHPGRVPCGTLGKTRAIFSPPTDPMEPHHKLEDEEACLDPMFSMRPATGNQASTLAG